MPEAVAKGGSLAFGFPCLVLDMAKGDRVKRFLRAWLEMSPFQHISESPWGLFKEDSSFCGWFKGKPNGTTANSRVRPILTRNAQKKKGGKKKHGHALFGVGSAGLLPVVRAACLHCKPS